MFVSNANKLSEGHSKQSFSINKQHNFLTENQNHSKIQNKTQPLYSFTNDHLISVISINIQIKTKKPLTKPIYFTAKQCK